MNNYKKIKEIIEKSDNSEILLPILQEIAYLEDLIEDVKKLPQIKTHPQYPEIQKLTPAARLFKDYSQLRRENTRIILSALKNEGVSDVDELKKMFDEYL